MGWRDTIAQEAAPIGWRESIVKETPTPNDAYFLGDVTQGVVAGAGKTGAAAIQRVNEMTKAPDNSSRVSAFYQAVLPYIRPDLAEEFKAIDANAIQQSGRNAANLLERERPKSIGGEVGNVLGEVAAPVAASAPFGLIAGGIAGGAVSGLTTPTQAGTVGQSVDEAGKNIAIDTGTGAAFGTGVSFLKALPSLAKTGLQKLTGIDKEALSALADADITPSLGAVSKSPAIKTIQNVLSRFPGSSSIIENSVQKASDDVTKKLVEFGIDRAVTPQQAGEVLADGIRHGIQRGKKRAEKLYNIFESYVSPTEDFAIPNSVKFLDDVGNRSSNPEVLKDLQGKAGFRIVKQMADSTADGKLNYRDIKYFRTQIRQMKGDAFNIGKNEKDLLEEAYSALTQDMRTAAASKGDRALRAFEKSNDLYRQFAQEANNNLVGVLNKNAPEQMYMALKQGTKLGGTKADSIMGQLNADQREVMRGSLFRELGGGGDKFNPLKAITEFDKLSPEAKTAFFKGAPSDMVKSYQKLSGAVRRLQNVKEYANPSGSGYTANLGLYFGGGVGGALNSDNPLEGAAKGAASMALLSTGANISARLMTSPTFIRWLARSPEIAKAGEKAVGAHFRILPRIADKNPEIADDIRKYLTSLGVVSMATSSP